MIKKLYAIELSGVCNMACDYCPYHLHQRRRGHMTWETLQETLAWISSGKMEAHSPLFLHLFGEPFQNPDFLEMAEMVKAVWPSISFSTNATTLTSERAAEIARIGFDWVTISSHAPMASSWGRQLLKQKGVNVEMHGGPDHNWGEQVEGQVSWTAPCEFEREDMAVVHWDGDVMACCITDSKAGKIGTVFDADLPGGENKAFSLCKNCHMKRKEKSDVEYETMPIRQKPLSGHQERLSGAG